MKYYVNSCYGWIRFSEIVLPDGMEEYSEDLKSFDEKRLKWDDQQWFPKGAVPKNDTSGLTAVTRSPR